MHPFAIKQKFLKVLWKENFNGDVQEFHKYQQMNNYISPLSIEHKKENNIECWKTIFCLGIITKMWQR